MDLLHGGEGCGFRGSLCQGFDAAAGEEGDDDPEYQGDDEEHVGTGERSLEPSNQIRTGGAGSGRAA